MITYSATLDVPAETATLLTELLVADRLRRGTGVGSRAASARDQAVLVLRWFREDADMTVLAADTKISIATGYRYLHEGIDALAAQAPDLHQVLEAGQAAGWDPCRPRRHPHPHRPVPDQGSRYRPRPVVLRQA